MLSQKGTHAVAAGAARRGEVDKDRLLLQEVPPLPRERIPRLQQRERGGSPGPGREWEDEGGGLFGEHHGARGFDHPPDYHSDDGFWEEDGFCEDDGFD